MNKPSVHHPASPLRGLRHVALLLVAAMVVVACGQKPGVHVAGAPDDGMGGLPPVAQDELPETPVVGEPAPENGETGDPGAPGTTGTTGPISTTGAPQTTGTTTGSTTGGDTTGGDTTGTTTGDDTTGTTTTGGDTTGSTGGVQGQDRTGVDENTITIGVHAPVTGAAPLPSRAFEQVDRLYFNWITKHKGQQILGRSEVRTNFRDDRYNPSSAIQVCREMATRSFFLVGGGGTDQIQACGRWANQNRVPYFSAGVTEIGLTGIPWYFASSMSYVQQADLLAQMVKQRFGDDLTAMVVTDTPNFMDAVAAWEEAVARHGINYHGTIRHPKGDETWYDSVALQLQSNNVRTVFMLTAPVDYIQFGGRAASQNYRPQFVGVGITMGLNTVTNAACLANRAGHNSLWFSPFPGLDVIDQLDPEFNQALQAENLHNDQPGDRDLYLALWGLQKVSHILFERYEQALGTDLTREDFRRIVAQQTNVRSNVFPELNYSPDNHFGARTVHLLRADCDEGRQNYTEATFASAF